MVHYLLIAWKDKKTNNSLHYLKHWENYISAIDTHRPSTVKFALLQFLSSLKVIISKTLVRAWILRKISKGQSEAKNKRNARWIWNFDFREKCWSMLQISKKWYEWHIEKYKKWVEKFMAERKRKTALEIAKTLEIGFVIISKCLCTC